MTVNDHPDLEALSAYYDGEAPEWADHVSVCSACQTRLEEFAAVADAVTAPVEAPRPRAVDAAIERALATAPGPERRSRSGRHGPASPGPEAPPPPGVDEVAVRRAAHARALTWTVAASVAALLVVVIGTVSWLGGNDGRDTTTADRALTQTVPTGGPEAATSEGAAGGTDFDGAVLGGELGPVDGPGPLVARVQPALQAAGALNDTAAAEDSAGPSSPAPGSGRRVVGTRPCEFEAREHDPGVDDVVYVATATWQGRPVVVLGFTRRDPPPRVTLMVLARDGCALVSSTPL